MLNLPLPVIQQQFLVLLHVTSNPNLEILFMFS
jgi:hypothetical protein